VDIVGYYQKNNYLSISVYSYVETKLIDMQNQIIEISIDIETSIFEFLSAYYYKHQNPPKTLYVKLNKAYLDELNETFKNIKFKKPEKGKFKSIINIANLNAKKHYSSDYLVYEDEKCRNANAYTELTKIFNLGENTLIHVFDMSNYGKNERVGGMIALTNGRFNKKLYRKFIIRNQNAISDIDMFKEVIKRQYERMIIEKQELPNLVIVDGGKNQIKIVQEQFKRLNLEIKIIGLVKNNKHETDHILTIQNKIISLNKNSGLYFYLVNIQNEVHRYAINFLKKKKIKTIV
jgi:excinuclease ABC subunit C